MITQTSPEHEPLPQSEVDRFNTELNLVGQSLLQKINEAIHLNRLFGFRGADYWSFDMDPSKKLVTPDNVPDNELVLVHTDHSLAEANRRSLIMGIALLSEDSTRTTEKKYFAFHFIKNTDKLARVTSATVDTSDFESAEDPKRENLIIEMRSTLVDPESVCSYEDLMDIHQIVRNLSPHIPASTGIDLEQDPSALVKATSLDLLRFKVD